jgi:hypothetical protein
LLSTQEIKTAVLFAYANRPFESSLAALRIISKNALMSTSQTINLDEQSRKIFILRLLQHQSWEHCAWSLQLNGRNQCLSLLKKATREVLSQCSSGDEIRRLHTLYGIDTAD